MDAPYRLFAFDLISDTLLAEMPCTALSFGTKIRAAGEMSCTVAIGDVAVDIDLYESMRAGRTAVYVTRLDKPVWGGIVWTRDYDVPTKQMRVSAASFESYLHHRLIWHTLTYPGAMDQYEVVRQLLLRMESDFNTVAVPSDGADPRPGAANINLEVETGFLGDVQDAQTWYGWELKAFGEVIEQYSDNLRGFEYYIRYERGENFGRPNTFAKFFEFIGPAPDQMPLGVPYVGERNRLDDNTFEYPGNVLTLALSENAEDAATRFWVVGGVEGADTNDDAKPRAAWVNEAYISAGWPLLEKVEASKHSSVSSPSTLAAYAERYGRAAAPPSGTVSVTVNGDMDPVVGTFFPGDWCRLIVHADDYFASFQANVFGDQEPLWRILGYQVTVPDAAHLPDVVTLDLEAVEIYQGDIQAS